MVLVYVGIGIAFYASVEKKARDGRRDTSDEAKLLAACNAIWLVIVGLYKATQPAVAAAQAPAAPAAAEVRTAAVLSNQEFAARSQKLREAMHGLTDGAIIEFFPTFQKLYGCPAFPAFVKSDIDRAMYFFSTLNPAILGLGARRLGTRLS